MAESCRRLTVGMMKLRSVFTPTSIAVCGVARQKKKALHSRTTALAAYSKLSCARKWFATPMYERRYCFPQLSHDAISELSSQHS